MADDLEMHRLLDDGEPHCTCGYSNRGKHLCQYHDHAIDELRASLRQRDFEIQGAIALHQSDMGGLRAIKRAAANLVGIMSSTDRFSWATSDNVRTFIAELKDALNYQ